MRILAVVLFVGVCLLLAGCLKFGDNIEELAPNVTMQHLQQVSSLTGIRFPEGSTGLAYYYLGDAIDDSLAAKITIPSDKKDAFLRNEIFQKGSTNAPYIHVGKSKPWWKVESLKERTERTLVLPQARFVECTFGIEEGQWVVYISRMST